MHVIPTEAVWGGMFERFTTQARQVVVAAQNEARALDHNYIGTEHLLLGLLDQPAGAAARALWSLDVSPEAAREQVEAMIGRGEHTPSGHIPFTPRAKKVLELSLREALALQQDYIGTEHLLLGLIHEGEGVGARVLLKLGADFDRTRAAVLGLVESETGARPRVRPQRLLRRRQEIDDLRTDNASLRTEVARLRRLLDDHGIDPGADGQDAG